MFEFRAPHHFHSPARRKNRGTLSRKLRVETMEGRAMLSGTPLQFVPLELNVGQFAVYNLEFAGVDARISTDAPHDDGGFINIAKLNFNADTNANTAIAGLATSLSSFNRGTFAPRNYLTLDVTGDLADWASTATDGLQPVPFGSFDTATEFGPGGPTLVINPTENHPGQSEGGAIPLHPIVAGVRDELAFASRDTLTANSAAARLNSQSSARLLATSEKAISGEWARAVIFEFAGDDAATHDGSWTTDQPAPSAATQPTPQPNDSINPIDIDRAAATTGNANASDSTQQADTSASALVGPLNAPTLIAGMLGGEMAAVPSGSTTASTDDAAAGSNANDANGALAVDDAFAQLGQSGAAFVESSTDRAFWSRARVATPLLMVLAMERIAAINSRRATKERSAEIVERPRLRRI